MPIDDRTPNRNYQLPNAGNFLSEDVARLRDALTAIDADVFARYTKTETDQKLADLINGAPGALDTLNELAAAMGDDPNFATTITNSLAGKPGFADVWTRTQADARYVQGVTQTENVFTGTGSQTTFALTQTPPTRESLLVTVDGVVQPTTAYNLSGSALILSAAPASGASIRVLMLGVAGPVQSASTLSFTQAGTGAVTRTVDSKLKEWVSAKDFGAVGDGVTDDTAAIQAAINYVCNAKTVWTGNSSTSPPAKISKRLLVPGGQYLLSATLKIDGDNLCFEGDGQGVTVFKRTGNYGNTFEVRVPRDPSFPPYGDVTGWHLSGVTLKNFSIVCFAMPSNGAHIRADACEFFTIENISFAGAYRCVHLRGCTRTYVKRLQYLDEGTTASNLSGNRLDLHTGYTPPAGSAFILVDRNGQGPINWSGKNSEVYIENCNIEVYENAYSFECGIALAGGDGIWITNTYIKNATKAGIYINPMDAYTTLTGIKIHNAWVDSTGGANCVLIENTPGARDATTYVLGDIDIRGCSLLTAQIGIQINSSQNRSTTINDCRINLCQQSGIYVGAHGFELKIVNNSIVGNNIGNTNSPAAIDILGGVSDFIIANNKCGGHIHNPAIKGLEKYGIKVHTGASDNYIITGNDCRRNQLGGILDSGSGGNKILSGNLTALVP